MKGTLFLILALPDAGSSLVPAAWTDFGVSLASKPGSRDSRRVLATIDELMRTRTVVDALLSRLDSKHSRPAAEEASMQLELLPRQESSQSLRVWQSIAQEQRSALITALARLLRKAVTTEQEQKRNPDER